jgi:hypothetical protein
MINRIKQSLMLAFVIALALSSAGAALAQTTAFTYQGRLTDNSNPANGIYDLTFKLFDSATVGSGAQQGATLSLTNVEVTNGTFSVQLDFGACASCFDGADRFLEISIKPSGGGAFTTLEPRQALTAAPYAIKSLSAATADGLSVTCVNCVTGNQIASVNGSAVSGAIPVASVPAGSADYIQNSSNLQASSNFNISGTGAANILSAVTQYNIGSNRILSNAGTNNLFAGVGAGTATTGSNNAFFGQGAGSANVTGSQNSAFGAGANISFGVITNATAIGANAFVTASNSLVLGSIIGLNGATASPNVGIGISAPQFKLHVIDQSNAGLRVQTDRTGGTVASFGGFGQFRIDAVGVVGGRLTITESGEVGLGVAAPAYKLHVVDDRFGLGLRVQTSGLGGVVASFGGAGDFRIDANGIDGGRFTVKESGFVGIGTNEPSDKLDVNGLIRFNALGAAGNTSLCRNSMNQISACSSSLRYKTNIANLHSGLNLINRLRPVTFDWKESKAHDLGLVAEEVAEVEPLLVTHNDKGQIEGVKYDRISAVLINAIKEQQAQIEAMRKENLEMKARLASLERSVLRSPQAVTISGNRQ